MERRWGSLRPSIHILRIAEWETRGRIRAAEASKQASHNIMTMFLHAAHGCAPLATGRRSPMLQLSLRPGEYLTIHGDIVVAARSALWQPRTFPSGRGRPQHPHCAGKGTGAVGGSPAGVPGISSPAARARKGRDAVYHWSAGAGAGRPHNGTAPGADGGRGQPGGSPGAAGQLEHLLPTVWEEELSGQIQALFRSKTAQDV